MFVLRNTSYNESFKEFSLSLFLKRKFKNAVIMVPKYLYGEKILPL